MVHIKFIEATSIGALQTRVDEFVASFEQENSPHEGCMLTDCDLTCVPGLYVATVIYED